MKPELKEAWIADLESGEHAQCRSVLCDGKGYCCLGRLAVVGGSMFVEHLFDDDSGEAEYLPTHINGVEINDGTELLSDAGLELFGLTPQQQTRLSRLNDGEKNRRDGNGNPLPDIEPQSFREIAKVIREEL
jgi:hypothetical protein